jgi:hypothetical protein
MIITKKKIEEIIDANGELIGVNDTPENGPNLETQANNTTDYNAQIHGQNFRNDFLGRMGFYFYEGEEEKPNKIVDDLARIMYERFINFLDYYHGNPNELEKDYEMHSEADFDSQPEKNRQTDYLWAKKIVSVLEPHLKGMEEESNPLNEDAVVEDKIVEKKTDNEIGEEKPSKEVLDKKIASLADKLNKLKKDDLNKLINLLEKD